jgi:membrane-associated protease RseP (regulator of RpoE activity)
MPPPKEAPPRFQARLTLHIGLFLATLLTATWAGANHYAAFLSEFDRRPVTVDWSLFLNGLWYSGTFLAILGAHEFGHYVYCRWYNIDASLPYFIPFPLLLTGTLGAVIRIREPFRTKRELFDVGVAGPIGGFVVLLPALFIGLSMSTIVPEPTQGIVLQLGEPLLFQWAAQLVAGPIPEGYTLNMHPMVFACWFGMFATALNLLPFGQLDGGHLTYAIFGDRISRGISLVAGITPIFLVALSTSWIFPALMMMALWKIAGLRHPPTLNPYEPISRGRRLVGAFALVMFVVCFTPQLIRVEDLMRAVAP